MYNLGIIIILILAIIGIIDIIGFFKYAINKYIEWRHQEFFKK